MTTILGVLASGSGSNFAAIQAAIATGQLAARIAVVVYNNPDAYVQERAVAAGIPAVLVNHRDFRDREQCDAELVRVLKAHDVELVVMAGWLRRVTETFLAGFPGRILNIHPSLLPSFPGLHAVQQALDYGVKYSGCTVHWVTLAVDQGPIIDQIAVPVLPEDTVETLQARIQAAEHELYPRAIAIVLQERAS